MSPSAPRSVSSYLEQLASALAGEDPALVQDALYDAEEYLRGEIASHPDKSEADVLELIASTYGVPEEVADVYLTREAAVSAALAQPRPRRAGSALGRYFAVLVDPKAYTALFYMLLSLATGIIYFTVAVTGLSMSAGLMLLIIGIPFLVLFLALVRVLSLTEGRIVEVLLGLRMPRRPPYESAGHPLLVRVKMLVSDARTWSTLLYLLLMLPLGIVYFTLAIFAVVVTLGLIVGSVARLLQSLGLVQVQGDFLVDLPLATMPLVLVLGVVLLPGIMYLFKGIGGLHARLAKQLLVSRIVATA